MMNIGKIVFGTILVTLPMLALATDDLTDDVFEEIKYEQSPNAQYTLGLMYLQGEGVKKDNKSGLSLLSESSQQGYYLASHRLGKIYMKGDVAKADPANAIKYITLAANKGYSPSQYLLGSLYQSGQQGVKKNHKTALKWYGLAADQGHKTAKLTLAKLSSEMIKSPELSASAAYENGLNFLKGRGVSRDYKQAVKWFSQSAEQGYADAQYNLGELYNKGRGVRKNKKVALQWYKSAAAQGHIKAKLRSRDCGFC
ncbi:MAG: sel1 repeat family protein [Ectothiorhodospiraceae bacterium]|nr:sel1 repeat family protein [Ectothiorhodospiraceae bacterium]